MAAVILLSLIIAIPSFVGIFFRVAPTFIFASIVTGELIVRFLGDDASLAAGAIVRSKYSSVVANIFLLVLPLLLTYIFLKGTLVRSKLFLSIIPILCCSLILFVFVVANLPSATQLNFMIDPVVGPILKSKDLVVVCGSLVVLATMWYTYKPRDRKKHK